MRKARGEGRIPQSQELPSALMIAALLLACAMSAGDLWHWFAKEVEDGLTLRMEGAMTVDSVAYVLRTKTTDSLVALAPFLLSMSIASIIGGIVVGGVGVSTGALKWDMARLTPSASLKTILSPKSGVALLTCLLKLMILGLLAWWFLRDKLDVCLSLAAATPLGGLKTSLELVLGLTWRITLAMIVIALADVIYQKWQYMRDLRMTREEVREEHRSHDGSPLVKARMRAVHQAMVRKRMLRQVPQADVVLANPTHVAVALKYDLATMEAPLVLAKGADLLCQKIKDIAREHGIPVVEKPELARSLYKSVEVGQSIPEALYVAVAEVLAMVYRMQRQHA